MWQLGSLLLCTTLCGPIGCGPPDSSVHGLLQEGHQSGLLCPPPGKLPNSGIETESLVSPALAGGIFTTGATWEAELTEPPPPQL